MTLMERWTMCAGKRSAVFHASAVHRELVPGTGTGGSEAEAQKGRVNVSVIVLKSVSASGHESEIGIGTANAIGHGRGTVGGKGHATVIVPANGAGELHHVVLTRLRDGTIPLVPL